MTIWFNKKITLELLTSSFDLKMEAHLGIEYLEIGPDFLKARMPVDERTKQPMGLLHGGANCVLAEGLASAASNICLDHTRQYAVGQTLTANHLKSARQGWVYGVTRPLHLGKRSHIFDVDITNEQGQLISSIRLTTAILDHQ